MVDSRPPFEGSRSLPNVGPFPLSATFNTTTGAGSLVFSETLANATLQRSRWRIRIGTEVRWPLTNNIVASFANVAIAASAVRAGVPLPVSIEYLGGDAGFTSLGGTPVPAFEPFPLTLTS